MPWEQDIGNPAETTMPLSQAAEAPRNPDRGGVDRRLSLQLVVLPLLLFSNHTNVPVACEAGSKACPWYPGVLGRKTKRWKPLNTCRSGELTVYKHIFRPYLRYLARRGNMTSCRKLPDTCSRRRGRLVGDECKNCKGAGDAEREGTLFTS